MSDAHMLSPAYNRAPVSGRNSLRELSWCGKLILRSDPDNQDLLARIASIIGIPIPLTPNTQNGSENKTCYWLGLNEWLLHCDLNRAPILVEDLRSGLDGCHYSVVDVSDYYTVLRLEGPDAVALLAKGCPLDIHPSVFKTGACAQTRFGHAGILLHKISASHGFDIQVRWSWTEYVWDYLLSAMKTV